MTHIQTEMNRSTTATTPAALLALETGEDSDADPDGYETVRASELLSCPPAGINNQDRAGNPPPPRGRHHIPAWLHMVAAGAATAGALLALVAGLVLGGAGCGDGSEFDLAAGSNSANDNRATAGSESSSEASNTNTNTSTNNNSNTNIWADVRGGEVCPVFGPYLGAPCVNGECPPHLICAGLGANQTGYCVARCYSRRDCPTGTGPNDYGNCVNGVCEP